MFGWLVCCSFIAGWSNEVSCVAIPLWRGIRSEQARKSYRSNASFPCYLIRWRLSLEADTLRNSVVNVFAHGMHDPFLTVNESSSSDACLRPANDAASTYKCNVSALRTLRNFPCHVTNLFAATSFSCWIEISVGAIVSVPH